MKVVFDHLTKEFEAKKNVPGTIAVNDFCFEIPDGKLVGLLGPSGCGKSTCLNLICGLLEATSGHIYFGDNDVTKLPPEKRGVGMVFQNYALYPHLTVRQNIAFPLENLKGDKKLSKQQINEKVAEAAKLVQLENLLDRKPAQLSGGQQQRVAIARSLVKMPNVLLLDEPLSNLDARLRLQTREQIRRIQQETGITTIFVTHDQEEAMSICDMIVLMKDGIVNQIGKPQDIYDDPCNLFVAKFLGTPAINVFKGYIRDNGLYIGDNRLSDFEAQDQEVSVAIRPEGFVVDEKGPFVCKYERTQVMGRDISIICHNENCISDEDIRAIVPSDIKIEDKEEIRFSLKKNKVFVFDSMEKRLCLKETI
ncbi:MAG: ABC transporter ATP-binding protein [Erysipelotrichaceae bacterium]